MSVPERGPGLFRDEALRAQREGREHGDVLRLPPGWTRSAYPLLLAAFAAALVFLAFGRITQYAEGPAVVRIVGREDVTAAAGGIVAAVEVAPGDAVEAGQTLVRLSDEQERVEAARARTAFEGHLVARLRDPSDESARRALIEARAALEAAEARLGARRIVSPRVGKVLDVRLREGQAVREGDAVVSLGSGKASPAIVGLLPGSFGPQLAAGQELRLVLAGYPHAHLAARVTHVADQIVGPTEARRVLGPGTSDSLELTGPVVVVRAELAADDFDAGDGRLPLRDGMAGRAEIALRRERLIVALLPWIRGLGAD